MKKTILALSLLSCISTTSMAQQLSPQEITATMNQGFALSDAKKPAEALEAFLTVGRNLENAQTDVERKVYVCSMTMAAMCYKKLERWKECYDLSVKLMALPMGDKERKDVEWGYVYSACMYASNFTRKANTPEERQRGRQILTEAEPHANAKLAKYVHSGLAHAWYVEASDCFMKSDWKKSYDYFMKAKEEYVKCGKYEDAASALSAATSCMTNLDRVEEARQTAQELLVMSRKAGDTFREMEALKTLKAMAKEKGDITLMRQYEESMDSLAEASSTLQSYIEYSIARGNETKADSKPNEAEQWYLKAKTMAEKSTDSKATANRYRSYVSLRDLYSSMGRYDEALVYAEKTIVETQNTMRNTSMQYYYPYGAMAEIYKKKGDKQRCYECIEQLFKGQKYTEELSEASSIYTTRGLCRYAFGDYNDAYNDLKQADELLAMKYSLSEGGRPELQALMGGTQNKLHNYDAAEQYYRNYADGMKAIYGENSVQYITAISYLASASAFAGHIDEGCKGYAEAEKQMKEVIKQRVPFMNATEREGFWAQLVSLFTRMTPYALKAQQCDTEFTKNSYDALVMTKSLLLESERSMYDVVKRNGTAEDMRDYTTLTGMKNRVKKWEKDYNANADSILAVSEQVRRLENSLTKRCRDYNDGTAFMNINYDKVKEALRQGEVLIDFTDFVSETLGRRYAAYIVNTTQQYPHLTSLFAERQIDSLNIAKSDLYYDADYAPEILRLVWEPLKAQVAEGATVYYVPSELLFNVALESLPLADGTLLGSHYRFVRLSSARELIAMREREQRKQPHTAVLYGGLAYDVDNATMETEAKKYDLSGIPVTRGEVSRGDSIYHELPGTEEETARIETLLRKSHWQVVPYTGTTGTAESFVSMHGRSPQLLHLATHGFYYTPSSAEKEDYLKGYTDAMQLSGIVLSGGNAAWLGKPMPQGVMGGIITANDIARLDLSGTDMVVLSACRTGQGKATAEGLYGLQRAFKKAGVGTIVMSLWDVSDASTPEFMATFYERLTANGWNKRAAFEEAKAMIRQKYPEPYYWAAFVMLD